MTLKKDPKRVIATLELLAKFGCGEALDAGEPRSY